MMTSANLVKYIKILYTSSNSFKASIASMKINDSEEQVESLMDQFFIPKTKNNKIFMRYTISEKAQPRKFTTHVSTDASPEKPSRSPEITYPHFMIIVSQFMSPEEWMEAYRYIKREANREKKQLGMTSIIDVLKNSESRLTRTWGTIDLQLEIYRMYTECPYPKRVADKISDMKRLGTFPIRTRTTFDAASIRRVIKQMKELLEGI